MGAESQKHATAIGPFRILRRLRGSSREVYLAEGEDKKRVVLKMYGAPLRNQGLFDPDIADSASIYARLSHPNIVRVVDLFSTDGKFVIALEYVDGSMLNVVGAALERAKLELDDVCCFYVGASIFAALAAAHRALDSAGRPSPLLHRNVNPSNVHVARDGEVKLGNFNVAPIIRVLRDSSPGFTWGSYGYFAPEQVRLEALDERSDTYSATLIVWELLARKKAIQRGELQDFEILKAMASPSFEPLDELRPDLDGAVREIVRHGMSLEPRERPAAAELEAVFRRAIGNADARARLAAALAGQIRVSSPRVAASSAVHDAPTIAPPPVSQDAAAEQEEEELPAIELHSLPPRPAEPNEPKPPPLPTARPRLPSSMETSRAFPPPPPPSEPIFAPPPIPHPPIEPVAPTPHALALDLPPQPIALPPPPIRAGGGWVKRVILAAAASIAGAVVIVAVTRKPPAVAAPASKAVETSEPARVDPGPIEPSPVVSTTPIVTKTSSVPADLGELVLPSSAAGHRIFVDGKVMGDGSKPIRVPCGNHTIRIGSGGAKRTVTAPCGDSLNL